MAHTKKQKPTAESLIDHLIAADYALAQASDAAGDPTLLRGLHPQDLSEWVDQLRGRLDAVAV